MSTSLTAISATATAAGDSSGITGGVCGDNGGMITNCSFDGSVNGNGNIVNYVGGVCGWNYGTITNCSNTGSVTGNGTRVNVGGGVCGHNSSDSTIANCYNTGSVSGTDSGTYTGGVCGENNGTITNCYWLSDAASSGIGAGTGSGTATEKPEAQFASGEVAWLLNSDQDEDDPWRQTIGTDTSPVLDSTHEEVFKVTAEETDYYCNSSFTLPAAPSKSGYSFVGWSAGSKTYEPGDSVPITGNVTFTAVWKAAVHRHRRL